MPSLPVGNRTLARMFRFVFHVRSGLARCERGALRAREARAARNAELRRAAPGGSGRNILFITVDQQRFDAIGVNGGAVARTPHLDALARRGRNYTRCHVQNVVCMPSRSTMLTGQHPRTHGVIANGISLPDDAPNVADHLRRTGGYHTALIGKAHFDPHLDLRLKFAENRLAAQGSMGPWRGFDHVELATHGPLVGHHYADWLWRNHPEDIGGFAGVLSGVGGGETGAPEVGHNPIARDRYHTDWVAARTEAWLRARPTGEPWFCWMSFPDPHHPFDPPLDEVRARIDWRDTPLPAGHPGDADRARAILAGKPRHWLDWYEGRFRNPEGGPTGFVPGALGVDQLREINAMIHVENELIDDAVGRVLGALDALGVADRTDVVFTSDHGELQGDFGLLFKGPYHVESLLRVPLIWAPADGATASLDAPVGHVDLAPTFCRIAGVEPMAGMEGTPLPAAASETRERVITTFDSQFSKVGMHLRTIYRDGWLCTVYRPRTHDLGGRFRLYWAIWGHGTTVPSYDGSEGELYDVHDDPNQWVNRWHDPSLRALRDALVADLEDHLPAARRPPLRVAAPT